MANLGDFEKDNLHKHGPSAHESANMDSSLKEDSAKDRHTAASTPSQSLHSSRSQGSFNTDPLSPLEHALTVSLETEAEQLARPGITYTKTGASLATNASRPSSFEVDFIEDDVEDPRNWPLWYKSLTLGVVSFQTWTVVLYSTSYTSSMPGMMKEFNVSSEPVATLGVTCYLLGLACGSLFLAPLSEMFGRRIVYIGSLGIFSILILPCALASSLTEVLVVRFIGAVAGSAMIANAPGTVSDVVSEQYRALAFSIWSIGPMNGPVTGPLVGGFAAEFLGWRWTNWIVAILAGVGWIFSLCMKETYAPSILKWRTAKMRKETGDERYWCRYDQKLSLFQTLKINLTRPFILSTTEPILWFWNAYIATIYGILYLCFVAYPLIFEDLRGWSAGYTGLAFLGMGLGTMMAILSEPLFRKIINSHKKDPETGRVTPEASVSIICIGAFLCPIGQLWFSWTSYPITIHWIWSILAGIPFGAGNVLVFIYATNYLAGSYGVFAASALAGSSVVRSFIGGTLPLAGPKMYAALTPQWAGTLLGLVQVAMIPIPIVFYLYGAKIRAKSPVIKRLRADALARELKAEAAAKRKERRDAREARDAEKADTILADTEIQRDEKSVVNVQPIKLDEDRLA